MQPLDPASTAAGTPQARRGWRSLQGWPTLVGAAFAAFVAFDLLRGDERGHELASIVAASGLVYLAAAALARPGVAWPVFLLSVVVITTAKVGLIAFDATWLLLGLAGLFVAYGSLRGLGRRSSGLPLQSAAMLAFGGVAVAALLIDGRAGAYLVAAGLFAHAGWDAYHHRKNKVVARSLAEFCFVLDVLVAAAIVVAAR